MSMDGQFCHTKTSMIPVTLSMDQYGPLKGEIKTCPYSSWTGVFTPIPLGLAQQLVGSKIGVAAAHTDVKSFWS